MSMTSMIAYHNIFLIKCIYHTNGNMQWEGSYDGGLKDGVWTNYSRNGEKRLQQIWEEHELTSVIDCTEDDCQ